jgi:hypothetical protein
MNTDNLAVLYGSNLLQHSSIIASRRCGKTLAKYPFAINDIENIVDDIKLIHFHDHTFRLQNIRQTGEDIIDWCVEEATLEKDKANNIRIHYKCNPKPLYILIIFNSTIGDNFTGGEHIYSDGYVVKPCVGDYVFFDAQEPYMVNPIMSGVRFCTKIIFY